jgi:hypothetical protein
MDRNAPDYRDQLEVHADFKDLADAIATLTVDGTPQQFPLHSQFLAKLSNHVSSYISTKKAENISSQLDLTELFKYEDVSIVLWFFYLAYNQDNYQSSLNDAVRDALQCLSTDDTKFVVAFKHLCPELLKINENTIRDPFNALVTFLQFCDKFEAPVGLWQCVEAAVAQNISKLAGITEISYLCATEPRKLYNGECILLSPTMVIEWTVLARQMEHRMPGLMDHIHGNSLFFKPRGGKMGVHLKDPINSIDDGDPLWQQAAEDWEEEFNQYGEEY